ncbi:MAG: phenylalanine--tRNA ligase subunit beta [Nitrospinae bacterium]|nr:phenylalanine--tRNA ligase subunit beta [Nitrospinota bacterium]
MKITYNWLKEFVEFKHSPSELSKLLTMAGLETNVIESIDDDHVIEVDLTPNRSDCHSVIGIAREVSALTGGRFKYPDISVKESEEDINSYVSVTIENPDLCHRYTGRIIRGVKVKPSPSWLEKKIIAVGLRPINNIVDATNYILWEMGQPIHAFDYEHIKGKKIIVRNAYKNESLATLDEKKHSLSEDSLVIADSERAVALAGVMGGENSGVTQATRDILLESAYFNPINIRRTSRRHGIFTDSSYRFERGVDNEGVVAALDRAANLIAELSEGKVVKGRIDCYPEKISYPQIDLRISRTNKILGISLSREQILNVLNRLMFTTKVIDDDNIRVNVPSFRKDIEREIDLIEEVARLHGYEKILKTIPSSKVSVSVSTKSQVFEKEARNILTSLGLTEVINYSFIDEKYFDAINIHQDDPLRKTIKLRNPLSQNWSVMRTTLLPGIINTAVFNINRGIYDVGIFEVGKVFIPNERLPVENMMIGCAATEKVEKKIWSKGDRDFYYLKGLVESLLGRLNIHGVKFFPVNLSYIHPQKGACVRINSEDIGCLGELSPAAAEGFDLKEKLYVFELSLDKIISKVVVERKYAHLPKYPSIYRDIAVVLNNNIKSDDVYRSIRDTDNSILKEIILFDYYEGKQIPDGKKSLAYSIVYRADDRTLTDDDVNPLHEKIIKNLKYKFGAVLRSG